MRARRTALALSAAIALAPSAGCIGSHSTRDVRSAIDDQMGVRLDRDFGLKMGFLSTKLALGVVRLASDEPIPMRGLSGLELAVYSLPEGERSRKPLRGLIDLELDGWETVLRVRDDGGEALVLVRQNGDSIRGLLFVVQDDSDRQVLVARLRGRLERLLEDSLRAGFDGAGHDGVREVIPTYQ